MIGHVLVIKESFKCLLNAHKLFHIIIYCKLFQLDAYFSTFPYFSYYGVGSADYVVDYMRIMLTSAQLWLSVAKHR